MAGLEVQIYLDKGKGISGRHYRLEPSSRRGRVKEHLCLADRTKVSPLHLTPSGAHLAGSRFGTPSSWFPSFTFSDAGAILGKGLVVFSGC